MKIVLTYPNNWCLNNNLTENKIYDVIQDFNSFPNFFILNDLNIKIKAPMQCFDTLKNTRKLKLQNIYGKI